jgi:hypothetical protein
MRGIFACLVVAAILPRATQAQSVEQRIKAVKNGSIRMSFAARAGVCGNRLNNISVRTPDDEWDSNCDGGPVRVALDIRDGRIAAVRSYVGGRWRDQAPATDLGSVRPQEAALFLIRLAEGGTEEAILPATLADSITIWPALLRLARTTETPEEIRKSAVFWLSQAAGKVVSQSLDSIATDSGGDREVRKQAVFALSQRSEPEAVPALVRIARTNHDREIRKAALFWLGQSDDPRALALFEEILR